VRVLVTGHDGYIGQVLMPLLRERGHDAVGLDSFLFRGCALGDEPPLGDAIERDVRDLTVDELEGFEAVIQLAAVSNDPIGELNPDCTYAINHRAAVHTARLARAAGVERFLFASSCSLYGAADGPDLLDENARFNPVSAYGKSKVLGERDLAELATNDFSPTFLRNGTAYGVSARQRGDLVVNNLVGLALTTGEVRLASDGSSWRPLVHIEDISGALIAALEAPRAAVHCRAFNVGRDEDNFRIRDVAELVADAVPGSRLTVANGASPDKRSYRVTFARIRAELPTFEPRWSVERGVGELVDAFKAHPFTLADFESARFVRIARIRELQADGRLDPDLRWARQAAAA
jgi:nucleoside-diphosphate-sugar epimerase